MLANESGEIFNYLKGKIIVFEGIDKAGKTTQSRMLFDYLRRNTNFEISIIDFPDYNSSTGQEIRSYLRGERESFSPEWLHVMYAANRYEWKKILEKSLTEKKIIILNRYYESNIAYGMSRNLDATWLKSLDSLMPKADITVIIDVPVRKSQERNYFPDKNESDLNLLDNVRTNFYELSKIYDWIILNGDRKKEEVHEDVVKLLKEKSVIS